MDYSQYLSAGVPTFGYFRLRVDELKRISAQANKLFNFESELCIIGLAAYFESFCKDQFAAIINICPETLKPFVNNRDLMISGKNILHLIQTFPYKLGFVVAEEYDFGSAKSINGLFCDLLRITPFSKSEMGRYSEFLNDRNLLVHHGGVFTLKYASQKFDAPDDIEAQSHYHSLTPKTEDVEAWGKFLLDLAEKIARASQAALLQFVNENGIDLDEERKKAIESFTWDM